MANENKNMTIDDLVRVIQREFLVSRKETGERFDKVDEDLGLVKGRLDAIEMELN